MKKKKYYFTAAFLREGTSQVKYIPNCQTIDGYLCSRSGMPFFNSLEFAKLGLDKETAKTFKKLEDVTEDYKPTLIRFGKIEGKYWVWNHEAAERKKTAKTKKVVFLY